MTTRLVRIILAYPFTSRCCQKTVDVETVRLLQLDVDVCVGSCQYVRKASHQEFVNTSTLTMPWQIQVKANVLHSFILRNTNLGLYDLLLGKW